MSSKVIVSKSSLLHNLRAYRRAIGDTKIMTVVKSNAYGHGIIETSNIVQQGADWFGVASGDEGLQLRKAGIRKPILVLSFYDSNQIKDLVAKKISLVVYDINQARIISNTAKKQKKTANIHLKVDTGTSRLGIFPKDVAKLVHDLLRLPNLKIEGVFSHFASSEDNLEFTHKQNRLFDNVVEELEWRGVNPIKHIACTASMLAVPQSRYDLVRLGIGLYGLGSSAKHKFPNLRLKPALSWQTSLIAIKDLPKGTFVGYGLTYQTKKATTIGIMPIGYFDGYDRKLSNQGTVFIKAKRCKVLGRICMNLAMVDVTEIENAKVGDMVELIGNEITADEIAEKIGTIDYEVVTRINPSIPRIFK